jgi:uncharacterized membrane protein (Fun14 family)
MIFTILFEVMALFLGGALIGFIIGYAVGVKETP